MSLLDIVLIKTPQQTQRVKQAAYQCKLSRVCHIQRHLRETSWILATERVVCWGGDWKNKQYSKGYLDSFTIEKGTFSAFVTCMDLMMNDSWWRGENAVCRLFCDSNYVRLTNKWLIIFNKGIWFCSIRDDWCMNRLLCVWKTTFSLLYLTLLTRVTVLVCFPVWIQDSSTEFI